MFPWSARTTLTLLVGIASCAWGDGPIAWRTDFDRAVGEAQATGKILLVNIHATWCIPCKKLNTTTLMDPALAAEITQSCIPVSLDADQDAGIIRRWPITGFPTQIFLTPDGQVLNSIVGHVPVATYQSALRQSLAQSSTSRPEPIAAPSAPISNQAPMQDSGGPSALSSTKPATPTANVIANMGPIAPIRNNGLAAPSRDSFVAPPPVASLKPQSSLPTSSITSVLPASPKTIAPSPTPTPAATFVSNSSTVAAPNRGMPGPSNLSSAPIETSRAQEVRSTVAGVSGTAEIRACDASVPLALDGYCPVSMFKKSELIRGAEDQCCVYKDKRYQFISAAERESFIQNPKRFLPSEDGLCVVTWAEDHRRLPGSIEFPAMFGDYLFLFGNDQARQRFLADPERYVDATGRAHRIPLHTFRGERSTVR